MPSLTLKATSKRCFEPKVLMILIECLPDEQRPPIKELLTSYPVEIKRNDPNTSVALKHGLNANLVSRWIRNFPHDGVVQDPVHAKLAFIALPSNIQSIYCRNVARSYHSASCQ